MMRKMFLSISAVYLLGIVLTATTAIYAADGAKTLPSSEVEKIIKEYVIKNTPWTEEQVNIKNVNISNKILLPEKWGYHIAAAPASSMIGRRRGCCDMIAPFFRKKYLVGNVYILYIYLFLCPRGVLNYILLYNLLNF